MTYRLFPKFIILQALTIVSTVWAQDFVSVRRVADLNPGGVGSFPSNFTAYAGSLYFSAYTFELGRELFRYDGTNILLVTNINDTVHDEGGGVFAGNDSVPQWLTLFNGALYFSAYDQRRGGELWKYDGTRAVRVSDINPDVNDVVKLSPNSSWPQELTVMGNALYFSADGSGFLLPNYELWKYDGVRATMVTNIHADFGTNHSSYPNHLKAWNSALYFMADDGLNGYELWKYDGTRAILFNLNPGGPDSSSYAQFFTPYKSNLYFQAYDNAHGFELWKTDGSTPSRIADINPTGSSYPELFIVFKDALFFRANDGVTGAELWKYDGTSATLAADINPFGDSTPQNFTVFQDNLYFAADDGVHGFELWKYDGTSASLVADLNPTGSSFPEELVVWNNRLYFTATNEANGYELWMFDGRKATLAANIIPGPASSFPFFPTGFGSEVCFSANDSYFSDWELWTVKVIPFSITRIEQIPSGIRLTWSALGGVTNIVQVADQITGPYYDLSPPIIIPGAGQSTATYTDTSEISGSRFYRITSP